MASKLTASPMAKSDADYQAEDDHRTLTRAEEVRSDPSRLKRAGLFHRKKMREMASVGKTLANPKRTIAKRPTMARASRGR